MYFFNGYRRSILSWRNYSRVKFVSLSINGLLLVKVRLMDTYKMQIIDLKKLSINAYYGKSLKITLKFDGLYFGGKYLNDIAISEIIFDQKRY